MTHLSNHFREQRLDQDISLGQLARMLGYRNVSRGANRILRFEQSGQAKAKDLPLRIANALGISDETVRQLEWQDYQDWQAWLNEPVPMQVVVRLMAAIYGRVRLPQGITPEKAEQFASELAREQQKQVCLVVSRRLSIYFDESGEVISRTEPEPNLPNMPYTQIGGKKLIFEIGTEGDANSQT